MMTCVRFMIMAFLCAAFVSCATDSGRSADASIKSVSASAFELRRVAADGAGPGNQTEGLPWAKAQPDGQTELRVERESLLDGRHVQKAAVVKDPITGKEQVEVRLTREGAAALANATKQNVGNKLAVVVRGKVLLAPTINEPITGGALMISGNFTAEEAREIAQLLAPKH